MHVDLAKERAFFRKTFMLFPRAWREYGYRRALAWEIVPFAARSRAKVPDRPGVYAFLIQPGVAPELNASYLVYIGETVSLHARFGDYIAEAAGVDSARIQLYGMFREYRGHVQFTYAVLPRNERKAAERHLLHSLTPPINKKLPATIARAERAF